MVAFTYASKASDSRRQYPRRFKIFLDYLNLKGSIEEQADQFYLEAINDLQWCEQSLMASVEYQKERAECKDEFGAQILSHLRFLSN